MMVVVVVVLIMLMMSDDRLIPAVKRRNDKRPGKVGAEHGEEEEFPLGIHVRALGEIFAQMAFGQKVREESRHAAPHRAEVCHEPARAALEGET